MGAGAAGGDLVGGAGDPLSCCGLALWAVLSPLGQILCPGPVSDPLFIFFLQFSIWPNSRVQPNLVSKGAVSWIVWGSQQRADVTLHQTGK